MTKEKISEYDASADGNTDVNGVNIAEGCAPSGINNAIREVMGALKRFETGADGDSITVGGNLVVSGSTTANTIGATVVNASGNATVGGTLVVSGSTTATTVSATVVQSDTISEKTSAAGVTVDGVLLKDTTVTANTIKASGTASSQGEIQLFEDTDNGTNYVALKAPASIDSDVTFVLPDADGTTGQALVTDGSGNLSFSSAGGSDYILRAYTSPTTWTKPAGLKAVKVTVVGGGGASRTATPAPTIPTNPVTSGGTSSFGSFLSATGGGLSSPNVPVLAGAGGSGSGGDINVSGQPGRDVPGGTSSVGGNSALGFGQGAIISDVGASGIAYGGGAHANTQNGGAGGGGASIEFISAPSIPGPVSVTVGAGGTISGPTAPNGGNGGAGIVIVEEFY